MDKKSIVIRLKSEQGFVRITMQPNETYLQLKEKVYYI